MSVKTTTTPRVVVPKSGPRAPLGKKSPNTDLNRVLPGSDDQGLAVAAFGSSI